MKNGDFINELSQKGTTKVLTAPNIRLFYWLTPTVLWSVLILAFTDRTVQLQPMMSLQFITMLFFVLWSAKWVFELSIPGNEDKYDIPYLMIPIGLWLISMGVNTFQVGAGHESDYLFYSHCFSGSLTIATGPTLLLYWLGTKAAPMKKQQVSALCMVCGVGIGALVSQLTCSLQESAHLLVSHYLPMLILASFGYILGSRIFKW